jgi:hypothetical protein
MVHSDKREGVMREIKFRAWDKESKVMFALHINPWWGASGIDKDTYMQSKVILMQFTGLYDKNGKEIYELMELDNRHRVIWHDGSYVLQSISKGDIIGILNQGEANEREITREYSPLS